MTINTVPSGLGATLAATATPAGAKAPETAHARPKARAQNGTLKSSVRWPTMLGGVGSIAMLIVLVGWAQMTEIGGAVIAQGQAVVRGNPKIVQSLDGGIVEAINVTNGDLVASGDVLMRLDPTLLQLNLEISRNRLAGTLARAARLEAEQLGLSAPEFIYPTLPFPELDTAREEEGQRQIFVARVEVQRGRREQFAEKVLQFDTQATGVEGLITARRSQLALINKELANVRVLYDRGLAREAQLLELQRTEADLLGQLAGHQAELARLRMAVRDAELEVVQSERLFKEQVVTDLRTARTEAEELMLEIVTIGRQLDRIEIKAPSAGIVHELQVTTLGGVVAPGATIVQIIPLDEGVSFEFRLDPRSIDQAFPGQPAQVVFPAFDQRTTPKLAGTVTSISPAAIVDPLTGQSYYRVEMGIAGEEIARLGDVALVPGMPIEAFLETGDRTVMNYLLRPLSAQIERAFREN